MELNILQKHQIVYYLMVYQCRLLVLFLKTEIHIIKSASCYMKSYYNTIDYLLNKDKTTYLYYLPIELIKHILYFASIKQNKNIIYNI